MGPPMTKRPVGLMKIFVFLSISPLGSARAITSSRTASWSFLLVISSECWVLRTTASMRAGLPSLYSTVTWLLPSGRSHGCCLRRASARRRVSACAKEMGAGMSSAVSSQA